MRVGISAAHDRLVTTNEPAPSTERRWVRKQTQSGDYYVDGLGEHRRALVPGPWHILGPLGRQALCGRIIKGLNVDLQTTSAAPARPEGQTCLECIRRHDENKPRARRPRR